MQKPADDLMSTCNNHEKLFGFKENTQLRCFKTKSSLENSGKPIFGSCSAAERG